MILSKINKRAIYITLIVFWIILLTLTSIPGKDLPEIKISDKIIHFGSFVILGFLLFLSLRAQNKSSVIKRLSPLFALFVLASYAFIDEQHQRLIPGRSCETGDMIADITGGFIGIIAAWLVFVLIKNRFFLLKKEMP